MPNDATTPQVMTDAQGRGLLGIHFGSPAAAVAGMIYDMERPGAGWLVARLVSLALVNAGLTDDRASWTGTLKDGITQIRTRDPLAAAEIIKAELKPVALLPLCQIAVFTLQYWHCIHPGPTTKVGWLLDSERTEMVDQRIQQECQRRQAALEELRARLEKLK